MVSSATTVMIGSDEDLNICLNNVCVINLSGKNFAKQVNFFLFVFHLIPN